MNPRTAGILEAVIREFISTGEPVSSGWLYENHEFGIKPAMIRWELKALADTGYLEQPNYSAGRVPTDKGYEFFANYALECAKGAEGDERLAGTLLRHAWNELSEQLAETLGLLSVVNTTRDIYKGGLEELIGRLDWQSRSEVTSVIHDFEALDARLAAVRESFLDEEHPIRVFVGRKSPVTRCDHLSVFAGDYDTGGGGDHVVLLAIGPKRMNYQKVAKIFKGLRAPSNKKQKK